MEKRVGLSVGTCCIYEVVEWEDTRRERIHYWPILDLTSVQSLCLRPQAVESLMGYCFVPISSTPFPWVHSLESYPLCQACFKTTWTKWPNWPLFPGNSLVIAMINSNALCWPSSQVLTEILNSDCVFVLRGMITYHAISMAQFECLVCKW